MEIRSGCYPTGARFGDLDELLDDLRRRRFWMVAFNADCHGPDVLAGVLRYREQRCVDVIVFRSRARAAAWRAPDSEPDKFDPARVHWACFGTSARIVSWLLELPAPGTPGAPGGLLETPPGVGVPAELRRRYRLWPAMARG